ncbi:MAG: PAS domain S-box protein [Candidatus Competibacteraceae bacterium]|nr:PAS domain S-box protein [Candidatus Competibacteraceae bacterium]
MNERIVWGLISLWTAIVAISLAWSWRQTEISVFELARVAAQSYFEKDLAYRRWVAMHGGVYVPPTAKTPPNPYLSYLEERDVITTSGTPLTLINPAYMTRQVHELGAERSGVQGHITSLKSIRPENAPDAWERQALQSFEQGVEEKVSLEPFGSNVYLRFMRPLITESSCLKCHEAQGYRRGDIRGGISVSAPFAPFLEIEQYQHRKLLLGHGVIGVLGVVSLWIGGRRLQRSRSRLQRSLQEVGQLAARDRLLLSSLGEGVYGADRDELCIFINPAALALLGYSEEEVIGKNQHQLFHAHRPDGEVYPSEECPVFLTLRDGQAREVEDSFVNKDGQSFPVSLLITPILEQGVIDGAIVSFRDISERRRAEQALTRSSEELRQAQAVAHVGSWRLDIVANELSWSEETYRIFGVPLHTSLTIKMFVNILHQNDRKAVLAAWQAALHGEPYDIEHRIVVDGQVKWVRERAKIRLDAHGCPIEGIGTVQDITQQRNTTDRLQTLLDTASDGVHILDEDGNMVEFSQSFSRMLGYTAEETSRLHVADWDAYFSRDQLANRMRELIREPATFETKHRRKDGSIFDVEINAKGIELGGRSCLYASSRNISERKKMEADLREARNRLSVVVNTIPDLIWLKDIEGVYLACNREFESFFGARENEIVGKTDYDFVPESLADFFRENDRAALESGKAYVNEEEVVYRSDGRRAFLETRKVPVTGADGRILSILGIGRDISERKRAESALRSAKEAADSASRAKSEFIANMSHEIRTPMNAIIGLSGLGLGLPGLSARLREYLTKIQSSSKALLFIINDILDFSKIEAERLELDSVTFNLEDMLHNVADLFSIGAEQKGVELVFELAPDVPQYLRGDPLRLGQVMNNLVGNAVKFTEAGEIHVKVNRLFSASSKGEESAELQFTVRDTGIGISLEQQEHLFEAFQQADGSVTRRFGGTGLGLAISKHLVQRMGGELILDSEPGQGSCFSFVLDLPVAGPPLANRTHAGLHGARVLVADDLDTSREMLREILRSWQFEVTEAASGHEALERLMQASESPDWTFDLVLLDWKMPQMDGVTVARRVHELVAAGVLPKAPVVMMITAYSRDQLLREVRELPLAAVLTKPVTPSRLFDAIMDARGGSTRSEPAVETEAGLSERAAPIRGAHVLLVEDNDINQTVARDMLERMGLVVTTAWNGKQALDCLDEGVFDAVLMDLHMPEMDGLEASRRIRVQHGFDRLPIIAMTAAVFEEDRATCEAVGMNAHVAKPIDPQDLLDTLLQWIEPRTEADRLESPRLPAPDLSVPDLGISGIDSRQALQRLGGNLNLFHSLLRLLAEEQGDAVEMARAALAAGQRDQAASRLHALRGVLGNIGAQETADLALTLERDLKSGTDTGIAEELQRLDRMLQGLFAAVGNYLSGVDGACPRDGDGTPSDLDTDAIATLLQALKEWDLAAVEQFDALYPAIRARLGVDQAQHLRTAMDCLEFSKVEKMLADIETQS